MKIQDLAIDPKLMAILTAQGYADLYPPQVDAVKQGVLDGKNLVLAIPTASGKTLIAILAMLKAILEGRGRALYLVPLRALASEKYREFKQYESLGIRVAYSTGDYDAIDRRLHDNDIVITTNEKADSLLRHRSDWMHELAVIVSDEVHLINDAHRGPTLEIVLAKLKEVNPNAQFLALSATIQNADEIAAWLNANLITSEWRPTKLNEGVYCQGNIIYKDEHQETIPPKSADGALNLALHTVQRQKQALVFVNTRRSTETFAKKASKSLGPLLSKTEQRAQEALATRILNAGERTRISNNLSAAIAKGAAFHHAGLSPRHREIIELAFRENQIKILSATPTLCISKDSKIWHNLGETNVVSFDPSYQAYALFGTKLKPIQIQNIIENRNFNKMIEITSVSGHSIKVTSNHRMLVKRNNQKEVVSASDILAGDRIATVGRLSHVTERDYTLRDFIIDNNLPIEDMAIDADISYLI